MVLFAILTAMKRLLLYLSLLSLSAVPLADMAAQTATTPDRQKPIIINNLSSATKDDLIHLSLQAHFNLPDFLITAVNTGTELTFIADIESINERKLMFDKKVLDIEWHKKLHLYALARHYVVEDVTFNRQANFNSLENALIYLGRYDDVPITEKALLVSSQATHTRVRIKLSRADLPPLLRLKSYVLYPRPLSSDWHQWSL